MIWSSNDDGKIMFAVEYEFSLWMLEGVSIVCRKTKTKLTTY